MGLCQNAAHARRAVRSACKQQGGRIEWRKRIAFGFALSRVVRLQGGGDHHERVACAGACSCVRVFELRPSSVQEGDAKVEGVLTSEFDTGCWPGEVCVLLEEAGVVSAAPSRFAVLAGQAVICKSVYTFSDPF